VGSDDWQRDLAHWPLTVMRVEPRPAVTH
jgi:hypothetical protein